MATFNSHIFKGEETVAEASVAAAMSDECDLLIGGKQSNQRDINEDTLDSTTEECCLDDDDDDINQFDRLTSHRPHKHTSSLMKLLWLRMKSIVPGAGGADPGGYEDDFSRDWTLDSGIIYKPGHSHQQANGKKFSLNNSNKQTSSATRVLFGRNWTISDSYNNSSKNNSHASFKFTNKTELNRRFYSHHDHPYLKNGHSCRRLLLTSLLSLIFLSATILVLVKLMNLLHESQRSLFSGRRGGGGDGRGQMFLASSLLHADNNTSSSEDKFYTDYEVEKVAQLDASQWIVSSPKCRIPFINPWDKSIEGYTELKEPFNCTKTLITNKAIGQPGEALTFVEANRLYFTERALKMNAMKECCYQIIARSEENDDDLVYSESCSQIEENGLRAPADLIQVQCSRFNYTNVHPFVVHELEEEEASGRVASKKLDLNQYYNVILVGVDTISRLNGLRQLSNTLRVLKDKFKALEFMGYNKVGENTFPNLIPLLSGLRPEQLTETQCWLASNYSQESETGDDFLDNCKYMWNFYQDLGYRTYFGEDWPAASTFNYLKQGFKRQPTTYYGRPFTIARDKLLLPPVKMGCTSPCLWDKSIVELDLNNLRNFLEEYNEVPHFAFHWINCPQHDDLNGASRIDGLLKKFFSSLKNLSQIDRTFVIFFSDHGYRWNNFVSTRIGHYESSLPLLTIAPPKHFIENHPHLYENLKLHTSTLLTPFDMFKTLIHIRNLGRKPSNRKLGKHNDNTTKSYTKQLKSSKKATLKENRSGTKTAVIQTTSTPSTKVDELGYTIGPTASTTIRQLHMPDGITFKQDFKTLSLMNNYSINELDRSCIDAGIPDNYCVCHAFSQLSASRQDVLGAAYYLVYVHLYSRIKDHLKLCHPLDLEKVHKAEYFDFKHMRKANNKSRKRRSTDQSTSTPTINTLSVGISTTALPLNGDGDDEDDESSEDEDNSNNKETKKSEDYLPNREYNIRFSTKPGGALFQEVVRSYADDLGACELEVEKLKSLMEDSTMDQKVKHSHILHMNRACKFSVHSDSISRLNLYRDQSKCVKNNIEVKKVCYCNNLLNKS